MNHTTIIIINPSFTMKLTEKIQEHYYYYALCHQNATHAMEYLKCSKQTLLKYVKIIEGLDFTLLELLDKKGKEKLTMGFAEYFVNHVKNPDQQIEIYPKIAHLNDPQKKLAITDLTECQICCEHSSQNIRLSCCGEFLCVQCFYKNIETLLNDITYGGVYCPCCKAFFSKKTIKQYLRVKAKLHPYKQRLIYGYPLNWIAYDDLSTTYPQIYRHNLLRKMIAIIRKVENINQRAIEPTYDFNELIKNENEPEKYYGVCATCCPVPLRFRLVHNFNSLKVKTVEKQCVNAEGNIVVLNNDMFQCQECSGEEDVEVKKCPHCGIRTLKPDGCNYVVCEDHRWCWICNERLEVNHNGHNVHYWMGPGTGPYSDECRESNNYNAEKYILKTCNCYSCRGRSGLRLCETFECNNTCLIGRKFCESCR